MAKGRKTGGKVKGSLNKSTKEAHEIMERLGVDPIANMAMIADRKVSCGTCIDEHRKPTGTTKYLLPPGQHSRECAITKAKLTSGQLLCTCEGIAERTCLSCFGTLWERIPTETMLKASAELAQYKHAKRKALEVTGADGGAIQHAHTIKFID